MGTFGFCPQFCQGTAQEFDVLFRTRTALLEVVDFSLELSKRVEGDAALFGKLFQLVVQVFKSWRVGLRDQVAQDALEGFKGLFSVLRLGLESLDFTADTFERLGKCLRQRRACVEAGREGLELRF